MKKKMMRTQLLIITGVALCVTITRGHRHSRRRLADPPNSATSVHRQMLAQVGSFGKVSERPASGQHPRRLAGRNNSPGPWDSHMEIECNPPNDKNRSHRRRLTNVKFKFGKELGRGGWGSVNITECLYPSGEKRIRAAKRISMKSPNYKNENAGARLQKIVSKTPSHFVNTVFKVQDTKTKNDGTLLLVLLELGHELNFSNHLKPRNGTIGEMIYEHSKKNQATKERILRFYAACLLRGIEDSHAKNIIHRDVKPENCIISLTNGYLKITDFGYSKQLIKETMEFSPGGRNGHGSVGTKWYRSPETLRGPRWRYQDATKYYGKEVDWWSFGVTLYEMLSTTTTHGNFPFRCDHGYGCTFTGCQQLTARICNKFLFPDPIAGVSEEGNDLLKQLLTADLSKRLTNSSKHPWKQGQLYAKLSRTINGSFREGAVVKVLKCDAVGKSGQHKYKVLVQAVNVDGNPQTDVMGDDLMRITVKEHPWFKDFPWEELETGRMKAPWMPLSAGLRAKVLKPSRDNTFAADTEVIIEKLDWDKGVYAESWICCKHPENPNVCNWVLKNNLKVLNHESTRFRSKSVTTPVKKRQSLSTTKSIPKKQVSAIPSNLPNVMDLTASRPLNAHGKRKRWVRAKSMPLAVRRNIQAQSVLVQTHIGKKRARSSSVALREQPPLKQRESPGCRDEFRKKQQRLLKQVEQQQANKRRSSIIC